MPKKPKNVSKEEALLSALRSLDNSKRIKLKESIDNILKIMPIAEKLLKHFSELEKLAKQNEKNVTQKTRATTPTKKLAGAKRSGTATDVVLAAIKRSKKGVDVESLKAKTGFEDKKLRNIVHRLYKQGKIKRVRRGTYVGA